MDTNTPNEANLFRFVGHTVPNDAHLRVLLPSSLKTELEQLARDTDRSVAWHVRQAIRTHLANQPTHEGAPQ